MSDDRRKEKDLKDKAYKVARDAFENGYTIEQFKVETLDPRMGESIRLAWAEYLLDDAKKGSPVVVVG